MTTALAFAAVLLDPSSQPDLSGRINPDPESQTQALLRAGTHPDLLVVTKELAAVSRDASIRDSKQRNIAKAVLEEFLIEPSTRTGSSTGARASKVFIVDEAELIDARGQNALLKTLEEPAPGRGIILVTSREEQLLPTIRSRAQRVAFAPLDENAMKAWMNRAKVDITGVGPGSVDWLIRFAEGSPGTFQTVRSTGIVKWHETLTPMLDDVARGKYPIDLAPSMGKLTDEWAQAWVDANEGASKDAANKNAARWLLRLFADHARHRLREIAKSASPGGIASAARWIDAIADCERTIEANVPPSFAFENLIARLASPSIDIA
jgi:DNA polymerase-3 subunit delta'